MPWEFLCLTYLKAYDAFRPGSGVAIKGDT